MASQKARPTRWDHYWAGLLIGASVLLSAPAAMAACRLSDFMSRPLSALSEIQRLSFVSQMTQTEYNKFKAAAPGSGDYYSVIAGSTNLAEARRKAQAKISGLSILNGTQSSQIWATDALTVEQLQKYVDCESHLRPGLILTGRLAKPGVMDIVFARILSVGVEKRTVTVVASDNIANIDPFKAFLRTLGEQDSFTVQHFALTLTNQNEPAVLIMRTGFESPRTLYIPAYPAPDVH